MTPVYLDNAATTQPLPELSALYERYSCELWTNPSSLYGPSIRTRAEVERVREQLERSFGTWGHRCLFTSGGTEGANMVIRQGAKRRKNASYVCGGLEHPCVEQSFAALREEGADVRWAPVESDGSTSTEALLSQVDGGTVLVSVMHVNNETGAVNDVAALARAVKTVAPQAVVHVDGVQGYLREVLHDASAIDYYTVSGHKVHAQKGTGAVFWAPGTPLKAYLRGGGQERGLRSGTENVFGILSLGEAERWFARNRKESGERLREARDAFQEEIQHAPFISFVEGPGRRAAHILSLFVRGIRGETLMHALEQDGVYIGIGSACSSRKGRGRIAQALHISEEKSRSMVRVSFSPMSVVSQVRYAARRLMERAAELGAR